MHLLSRLLARRIRVVRDAGAASRLGLPVLGVIPEFAPSGTSSLPDESSPAALEAYQRLAAAVRAPEFHVRGRAIVVTGAEPGAGRSLAVNLANLLARGGSKVILVDADLRRAVRRRTGEDSGSTGLAGLLMNQVRTPHRAIVHTMDPNLKLLPVGSVTGSPSLLLRSPRLPLVLDALRAVADHVVFEAPPPHEWAETLSLTRRSDATLLALAAGRTRLTLARRAAGALREVNHGLLGVVLEHAPAQSPQPRVERQLALEIEAASRSAAPAEERLELAVADLLADLEDAVRLIRSLRQVSGDRAAALRREADLLAIER